MKSALIISGIVAGVAVVAAIAAGPAPANYPKQITYVPAEKRLNAIKHGLTSAQGTNELVPRDKDLGVRVSMGKVNPPATKAAEAHATFGHVFLIEDGDGTLVLGGEIENVKEGRPGEWTGTAVKGGQEFRMKKGDMITVQVGMPHWWKEVGSGGVTYLAFHSFPEHNQPK
jgi:mannose-6-phosphate isomerase-like protein (cupin superfamily)